MDGGYIVMNILVYRKNKHFKFKSFLLVNINQSLFLMGFLSICFILHFKSFSEIIDTNLQNGAVILIISSIVTEYIFFIIHVFSMIANAVREWRIKRIADNIEKTKKNQIQDSKSKDSTRVAQKKPKSYDYIVMEKDIEPKVVEPLRIEIAVPKKSKSRNISLTKAVKKVSTINKISKNLGGNSVRGKKRKPVSNLLNLNPGASSSTNRFNDIDVEIEVEKNNIQKDIKEDDYCRDFASSKTVKNKVRINKGKRISKIAEITSKTNIVITKDTVKVKTADIKKQHKELFNYENKPQMLESVSNITDSNLNRISEHLSDVYDDIFHTQVQKPREVPERKKITLRKRNTRNNRNSQSDFPQNWALRTGSTIKPDLSATLDVKEDNTNGQSIDPLWRASEGAYGNAINSNNLINKLNKTPVDILANINEADEIDSPSH